MKMRYRLMTALTLITVLSLFATSYAAEKEPVTGICANCLFKELQCPLVRQYDGDGVKIFNIDAGKYGLNLPVGVTMEFVPSMDTKVLDSGMLKSSLAARPAEWSSRIGEDSRQWFRSDGGTVLFRRNNVIVKFSYLGDQKSAEDLAMGIDNLLYKGKYSKPAPKK